MIATEIKELLQARLSKILEAPVSNFNISSVGGGSINHTYRLKINNTKNFFLKLNSNSYLPGLFEKEMNGLAFLANQQCVLTPAVILFEEYDNYQLLLLEWVDPGARAKGFWEKFGEQLAQLHHKNADHFGFEEDNYMGALPQKNEKADEWHEFFIHCRLQPQIEMAHRNGLLGVRHLRDFTNLFNKLHAIFDREKPSLLHGDLWSGNFICNDRSLPVLIDPAVYFGHRSMDLAMTTLFGGFDKAFYDSYHYHFPLPPNHEEQWEVCNLYPLLIHLNLFGSSYLNGIEETLKRIAR